MKVTEINKEFYNKLYKKRNPFVSLVYSFISFDQQSKSKNNIRVIKKFFGRNFSNELKVLDYGFGHGSMLLKYKRNHKLFGCDIAKEAVYNFPSVAKLIGQTVQTVTVEEFDEKFKEQEFDIISLSHIIEHVDNDLDLVKSLSDKLSPRGAILINVPINEVWLDPKHVRAYTLESTTELINKCGLKLELSLETDKLTSFFLKEEKVKKAGKLKLIILKSLRLLFAIIPLSVSQRFESIFLKSHKNQQLLVLAIKD